MIVCKLLGLPAVLVSFVFAVLFFVLLFSTMIIPLLFCLKEIGFKVWLGFSGGLVAIPFLIFSLVWAILGLIIWILLLPCGAGEIHLQFLVGVPWMALLALGEGLVGGGLARDDNWVPES